MTLIETCDIFAITFLQKSYFQFDDPEENRNLAMEPDMELPLAVFSERLHAGWRAEASKYDN